MALVAEPFREVGRAHDVDGPFHGGVKSAAILIAEKAIGADLGGLKPFLGVAAGNYVHLHAEGGDGEIVDDVFGGHHQADGNVHGDVQLIDFARPFGMLEVPHPLLADDKNFHGALGRTGGGEKEAGAPEEKNNANEAGNHDPGEFEGQGLLGRRRDLVLRAAAVLDHEVEDRGEDESGEEKRDAGEKEEEVVHALGTDGSDGRAQVGPLRKEKRVGC